MGTDTVQTRCRHSTDIRHEAPMQHRHRNSTDTAQTQRRHSADTAKTSFTPRPCMQWAQGVARSCDRERGENCVQTACELRANCAGSPKRCLSWRASAARKARVRACIHRSCTGVGLPDSCCGTSSRRAPTTPVTIRSSGSSGKMIRSPEEIGHS